MGVPKFFRYYAERYPCIINGFDGEAPMHFDNLYLDMNGIIHTCTHGNAPDLTKLNDYDDMARAICVYIATLFDAVKPRKNFVLCVDGVAPRAKMNQQRQRRFRKEEEALAAWKEATDEGKDVKHPNDVFDSNVITPGTPFMVEFDRHFRYFIEHKMNTDPSWQQPVITYSGHDVPGEGEHKVMDFIRTRRQAPGYDANETHCLYGLDADLIMLALVLHEPHFVLLREVVNFDSKKDAEKKEAEKERGLAKEQLELAPQYVLLHVETFRNYLEQDMRLLHYDAPPEVEQGADAAAPAPSRWNPEWARVENDFVVMAFLIGNDFLPGMPTLAISSKAMPEMFHVYNTCVLQAGLHLSDGADIDWKAMSAFMTAIGGEELRMIREQEKAQREYNDRQKRFDPTFNPPPVPNTTDLEQAKTRHYTAKLGFGKDDSYDAKKVNDLCAMWVEGVEWVWKYYVQGVPSWSWYFAHHYAPFANDVGRYLTTHEVKVEFEASAPLLPFQQLFGVLPPLSIKRCLPKGFWDLPTAAHLQYGFPERVEIDKEKARAPWEGVVVIPFLEHAHIISESEKLDATLTPDERSRNKVGDVVEYTFDPRAAGEPPRRVVATIAGCPDVVKSRVAVREYRKTDYHTSFQPAPLPDACPGGAYGFAALKNNPYFDGCVFLSDESNAVTIFDRKSFNESLILKLRRVPAGDGELGTLEQHKGLLGQWVYVDWPHMRLARVAAVTTRDCGVRGKGEVFYNTTEEQTKFDVRARQHHKKLCEKRGIDVDVSVLVTVRVQAGVVAQRNELRRVAAAQDLVFPLQLVVPQDAIVGRVVFPRDRDVGAPRATPWRGLPCAYIPRKAAEGLEHLSRCTGTIKQDPSEEKTVQLSLQPARPPPTIPPAFAGALGTAGWLPLPAIVDALTTHTRTNVPIRNLMLLCGAIQTNKAFDQIEIGLSLFLENGVKGAVARLGYAKYETRKAKQPADAAYYMTMGTGQCAISRMNGGRGGGKKGGKGGGKGVKGGGDIDDAPPADGTWLLSPAAVEIVVECCTRFAPLLDALDGQSPDYFDPTQLCTGEWRDRQAADLVREINEWVAAQPHIAQPLVGATEEVVPKDALLKLEECIVAAGAAADAAADAPKQVLEVAKDLQDVYTPLFMCKAKAAGKWAHLLAPPTSDEQAHIGLGTRVVNMKAYGLIPFGARGTVSRVLDDHATIEVVLDDEHMGCTRLGGRLRTYRGALVRKQYVLPVGGMVNLEKQKKADHHVDTNGSGKGGHKGGKKNKKHGKGAPNGAGAHVDVHAPEAVPSSPTHVGVDAEQAHKGNGGRGKGKGKGKGGKHGGRGGKGGKKGGGRGRGANAARE